METAGNFNVTRMCSMDELIEDFKDFCAYEGHGLCWLLDGYEFKGDKCELDKSKVFDLQRWVDRDDAEPVACSG